MFDNYTIKKILPRLIIAVIAIQLSFFLSQILVDFSNVLGAGVNELFTALVGDVNTAGAAEELGAAISSSFGGALGVGVGLGGVLLGLAAVVFFPGLALALAMIVLPFIFTVLLTLMARFVVVILLTILAPVAMLAWVLPNTEKYAKQWLSLFVKTLMMYPMIMFLQSVSAIASISIASAIASADTDGAKDGLFAVMALGAMVIPLAAVPFTFKFAGAALGAISNAVSKATTRMASPLKKKGLEMAGSQAQRSRRGTRFNNRVLNRAGQIATGRFGITKKGQQKRSAAHYQHTLEGAKHLYEAGLTEEHALNSLAEAHGDVDEAQRVLARKQARGEITADEYQRSQAQIDLARSVPHMTKEGLMTSAAYAAAYQGRASSGAFEALNHVEDATVRSAVMRKMQDDSKAAGQLEGKGATGMDASGNVYGFDSDEGRAKFKATVHTLSTADWQRAKSKTGIYAAPMLAQRMVEEQAVLRSDTATEQEKDAARITLGNLTDEAATVGHYMDPAAKNALEGELRGHPELLEGYEQVRQHMLAPDGSGEVSVGQRGSHIGGRNPSDETELPIPGGGAGGGPGGTGGPPAAPPIGGGLPGG